MPEKQKSAVATQATEQQSGVGLLDQIVEQGRLGKDPAARERGKSLVKEFVNQVLQGEMTVSRDTESMINARIAQIDHLLSLQLNEVLHHPDFQKLEAIWRGLKYMLDQSETSDMLKIKILNCSKRDLLRDSAARPGIRPERVVQEGLRRRIRHLRRRSFRRAAWAITNSARARKTSNCSRRSPTWLRPRTRRSFPAASSEMFNMDSFTNLDAPRDIAKIFDTTEYAKWKSFRQSEDSRYVALCVPHILMRLPYGKDNVQVDGFNYEENVDGTDHSKYLWANAAWALGARLTQSFAQFGWCASIRGVEGGGLVEGLPAHNFRTDEGDIALKCPTEVADQRPSRKGTGGSGLRAAGALQGHRLRRVLQRAVLPRSPSCTTRKPPTPTRAFRRRCRTFWRCPASRTT